MRRKLLIAVPIAVVIAVIAWIAGDWLYGTDGALAFAFIGAAVVLVTAFPIERDPRGNRR